MKLFVVLLAVAGLAFASGTISGRPGGTGGGYWLPETDDILDSYAYNAAEQMDTIGASFDDYAVIDDFPMGAILEKYTCWGVTTAAAPTALNLLIVADDGGVPTGAPISMNSYAASCGNSGFTYGGYTIWVAEIDLNDNPAVDNNWLGSHRSGTNWYPVGGTTITGAEGHRTTAAGWNWQSFTASGIPAGDLFKVIEGTPSSLERNTWAGIKNMF